MGDQPSDTMTDTVVWTRFPAHRLPANWNDHNAAHQAVMRLFPEQLPGPAGQRRAHNNILYRIEPIGDTVWVLIQSTTSPLLLPQDTQSITLSPEAWNTPHGARIQFRVAVNPIKRTGASKPGHPNSKTRDTTRVLTAEETPAWVTEKLAHAGLENIEFFNHCRDTTRSRTKNPRTLIVDTLDGFATVHSPEQLTHARLHGIGRSKAYGCGLITASPAGN